MRKSKRKRKQVTNINDPLTRPQAFSPPSSSSPTQKLSIPIQFLNKLSTSQVADLKTHILSKNHCELLMNPTNVDEETTPEEISSFTSVTAKDGNWFYDHIIR